MGIISYFLVQGVCWALPSAGWLLGFGAAGPIGGTIAAAAQTYIGGTIAAGSYFSICQQAAMGAAAISPL